MTGADALQRPLQHQQHQQQRRSDTKSTTDAISLAAQIRSFNQQQFADTKTTDPRRDVEMDVDSLFHDSDDDDDDDDDDQQQQQHQYGDKGNESEYAAHSITGYESEDEVDEEEEAAFAMMDQLQLLQTRNVRKSAVVAAALRSDTNARSAISTHRKRTDTNQHTSSVSAGMELTQAEERIAALEAQLLDAEEAICHLKAEKLAAFREVEKLTVSLQKQQQNQQQRSSEDNNASIKNEKKTKPESVSIWKMTASSDEDEVKPEQHERDSGDDNNKEDDQSTWGARELRAKVQDLEERLIEQQENQSLEQEEHMAVIREQELEIQKLKLDLERTNETCEDLEARLYRAFQVTSPVSSSSPVPKRRSKSGQHVEFTSNHEEEEGGDDDGYDDGVFMRRSLGSLKGLRSPSLDSSTSISPGSESGSSSVGPLSNSESHLVMRWREELIRHPTPHFDLDSPEVHYLLHSWTTNLQKLHYLRMWFTQVVTTRGPLAHDFPLGVELPRLLPEIRDGFLTLVVPLLRKQTQRDIQVHSRQYNDQYHTDLRIRVIPRKL